MACFLSVLGGIAQGAVLSPREEQEHLAQEGQWMAPSLEEETELVGDGSVLHPAYGQKWERQDSRAKAGKGQEKNGFRISKENPMVVQADKMRYNHANGEIEAFGNVEIHHLMDTYQTQYVYGNTITQQYVIPGEVRWQNPTTRVRAERAEYDGKNGKGQLEKLSGWEEDTYYFQGDHGTYDRNTNQVTVENGYFTTRHAVAKVPDYRIEAESIEIYPGDRYVAHNLKLMAKNTPLLTLSRYTGSLKKDNSVSPWTLIPRPGYDSDNGISLHNSVAIPLDKDMNLTVYMDNRWYSRAGYKPDLGIQYNTSVGHLNFHYAEKQTATNDDGGIWVKKRPSLEFESNHFYLFGSRFYTAISGEWGYWEEGSVKGAYKGYDAYISSDPWKLGQFMHFNWRVGYAKDYYSATDTIRSIGYYGIGLSGKYRSVSSWISYTNRNINGESPYRYDTYSSDKPLDVGFRVQATRLDAFSLAWSIDTKDGTLKHRYWTYYRDLHSFYAWLRYDDVERETQFMITPKDFKF